MNSKVFHKWYGNSSGYLRKGLCFGHKSFRLAKTSFWHPLMSQSLVGLRQESSFFDTQHTLKSVLRAFHILTLILKQKGHVLIISTNPEFFPLCNNLYHLTLKGKSKKLKTSQISYINYKWTGGLLTNWKQISKAVLSFSLFSQQFENFLKTNKLAFPKYVRVKNCFQGLISPHKKKLVFQKKPDLIFVLNPNENQDVINEASLLRIPVIALTEANSHPKKITYPIPANNCSIWWIYYCFKKIIKMTHL
jgi:small subunit ribosomal protein S2